MELTPKKALPEAENKVFSSYQEFMKWARSNHCAEFFVRRKAADGRVTVLIMRRPRI